MTAPTVLYQYACPVCGQRTHSRRDDATAQADLIEHIARRHPATGRNNRQGADHA